MQKMIKTYAALLALVLSCHPGNAQYTSHVVHIELGPAGYDYYAPFRFGEQLYFTSNISEKEKNTTRLYSADRLVRGISPLNIGPEKKGTGVSGMTLSPDGSTLYYTLCREEGQEDICTIWKRKKEYEGKWGAATPVPVNCRGYTTAHPAMGYDRELKKYVLFFASDRPGGKGRMDIWRAVIHPDGTYGQPVPLPFNTAMDEITPFFHQTSQTLFFSSNRIGSYGGFDIYSTKKTNDGEWEQPFNRGTVINTAWDETHYMYHTRSRQSYFTSNKPLPGQPLKSNGKGFWNIYQTDVVLQLQLPVYNIHNDKQLHGTMAQVYNETTGEKKIYNEQPFDPLLIVPLEPGYIYKIVVLKNGFMPAVIETSTEGVQFPVTMKHKVQLFEDEALTNSTRETHFQQDEALPVSNEKKRPKIRPLRIKN